MKLIVGLGNPGRLYIDSRHNIGFRVLRGLAGACKVALKRDSNTFSLSAQGRIEGQNVILALPLTFMNLSGVAVKALLRKYKLDLDNLLVVCDDLDLEFGRLKIRGSGSSGGQGGLKSIIGTLRSREFCRLRLGIGKPPKNVDAAGYVLLPFLKKENKELGDLIERTTDCCRFWVSHGIAKSMSRFNKKEQK